MTPIANSSAWSAGELEGKPFTVVYAESENREEIFNGTGNISSSAPPSGKPQHQYTLHNGHAVNLEITDSFIEVQGRPLLMLSLFRDVTAQRRLEEQLRQSQKMEAIGQLAGGVAHDFNNILTVIHGHASLLLASGLDDTGARSAQQITQAAERAAGLTRQLLTFSRRQLIQPKQLDMNKIVGNMTDMLGRLLGEDIALQLNYAQSPATVEADAGMMEQVLLNLAVNARDAMPRGGQLGVRISIVDVNEDHVPRHPEARTGTFVCVSKSDTGCGIPPENLPRIFEPFFTTKEIGKGTGLGLATVYGIVKQHQGWIEVESDVGKGTTSAFTFPTSALTQPEAEKPTTQIHRRGGNETILLVEDENPVRELVARILEKYGYKILQAGTGAEAVEVWAGTQGKIALLLTDLVMPGSMNGRELAETLWAEQPDLKVIFTSGYSADIVGKDFKLESDTNFLQKPYHPQTLALTVRRCLDGKHALNLQTFLCATIRLNSAHDYRALAARRKPRRLWQGRRARLQIRRRLAAPRHHGRPFRPEHFLRPAGRQSRPPVEQNFFRRASDVQQAGNSARTVCQSRRGRNDHPCRTRRTSRAAHLENKKPRQKSRPRRQSAHAHFPSRSRFWTKLICCS